MNNGRGIGPGTTLPAYGPPGRPPGRAWPTAYQLHLRRSRLVRHASFELDLHRGGHRAAVPSGGAHVRRCLERGRTDPRRQAPRRRRARQARLRPPPHQRGPGAAAQADLVARTTSSRSGCPTCTASAATSPPAACSRSASPAGRCSSALLVGIVIVQVFCNLVAKPSQMTGVPYPVINRAIFGVLGANIPAIIRGLIAVAWYGVQTYLAVESLNIIFLKFFPATADADSTQPASSACPRSAGSRYAILWVAQAALFWTRHGDDPPVHRLGRPRRLRRDGRARGLPGGQGGWATSPSTCPTASSSASGRRSRRCSARSRWSCPTSPARCSTSATSPGTARSFTAVKKGNFLGLPVNFLVLLPADGDHRVGDRAGLR